ncbi:MAG TPA: hypothetical protein VFK40_01040 [Nitrososphaeraceae archaeon]|nr:hypothetical protein [Nitrososphaeraceae archaeon]
MAEDTKDDKINAEKKENSDKPNSGKKDKRQIAEYKPILKFIAVIVIVISILWTFFSSLNAILDNLDSFSAKQGERGYNGTDGKPGLPGPPGKPGYNGTDGKPGLTTIVSKTYHVINSSSSIEDDVTHTIIAYCHEGDTVLSGGYQSQPNNVEFFVTAEKPSDLNFTGWNVTIFPTQTINKFDVYAYCFDNS